MKNVIVIGPPGSGKDTQIEELKNVFSFEMISGGDIARKLSEGNPELKTIVDNGGLLEDNMILEVADKMVEAVPREKGIVFDGFPRTLHQAERVYEILSHHNRNLDAVIYIELDEEKIVSRLSRRKVCSFCGKNVHVGSKKCFICGGRPVSREDDKPAVIIKRVQTFLERTLPLVDYFQNKGVLINIDGDQTIDKVAVDIAKGLTDVSNR